MHSGRTRRIGSPLVLAGLVLVALMLGPWCAPAGAHARLVGSSPSADATVPTAPSEVRLTFDESVSVTDDGVRVLGPDGTDLSTSAAQSAGATSVVRSIDAGAIRGSVTVSYRVLSADGHVVSGSFSFSIGERSSGATGAGASGPWSARVLDVVGRWLAFSGLLLAGGTVVLASFEARRLGPALLDRRRVLLGGVVATMVGAALALLGAAVGYGGSLSAVTGVLGDLLTSSQTGRITAIRVALAALLVVLVASRWLLTRLAWLVALGVIVGVVLPAFGGHATTVEPVLVGTLVDALHLLTAAIWVGGLGALALRWAGERPQLPAFSQVAMIAAPVVVVTGLAGAWIHLGSLGDLTSTSYGQLLLGKSALVVAMLVLAVLNRRQLADATRAVLDLAASVRAEAALGLAVVALTAVLVVTPPPASAIAQPVDVSAVAGDVAVQLQVVDAVAGSNQVHLFFDRTSGGPASVDAVELRISAPDVAERRVPLVPISPSHASADDVVLTPGRWSFRVNVVVKGRPATADFEVPIS